MYTALLLSLYCTSSFLTNILGMDNRSAETEIASDSEAARRKTDITPGQPEPLSQSPLFMYHCQC